MKQLLAKLPIDDALLIDLRILMAPWLDEDFIDPLDGQAAGRMLARLPGVEKGTSLHINLAKRYAVSEPGQCSAWSLTLDLNDTDMTFSECATYLTDQGSSDSVAAPIFTCNVHGYEEGGLGEALLEFELGVKRAGFNVERQKHGDRVSLEWPVFDAALKTAYRVER